MSSLPKKAKRYIGRVIITKANASLFNPLQQKNKVVLEKRENRTMES
jgi:hypothetical protein